MDVPKNIDESAISASQFCSQRCNAYLNKVVGNAVDVTGNNSDAHPCGKWEVPTSQVYTIHVNCLGNVSTQYSIPCSILHCKIQHSIGMQLKALIFHTKIHCTGKHTGCVCISWGTQFYGYDASTAAPPPSCVRKI